MVAEQIKSANTEPLSDSLTGAALTIMTGERPVARDVPRAECDKLKLEDENLEFKTRTVPMNPLQGIAVPDFSGINVSGKRPLSPYSGSPAIDYSDEEPAAYAARPVRSHLDLARESREIHEAYARLEVLNLSPLVADDSEPLLRSPMSTPPFERETRRHEDDFEYNPELGFKSHLSPRTRAEAYMTAIHDLDVRRPEAAEKKSPLPPALESDPGYDEFTIPLPRAAFGPGDVACTWHDREVDIDDVWQRRGFSSGHLIVYTYDDPLHTTLVRTDPAAAPEDLIYHYLMQTPPTARVLTILQSLATPNRVDIFDVCSLQPDEIPEGVTSAWWMRDGPVRLLDVYRGCTADGHTHPRGGCGHPLGHAMFAPVKERCDCNELVYTSAAFSSLLTHPNLDDAVLRRLAEGEIVPRRFTAYRRPLLVRMLCSLPDVLRGQSKPPVIVGSLLTTRALAVFFGTCVEELLHYSFTLVSPVLAIAMGFAHAVTEVAIHGDHLTPLDQLFRILVHTGLSALRCFSGPAARVLHLVWNAFVFMMSELSDTAFSRNLLMAKSDKVYKPVKNNPQRDHDGSGPRRSKAEIRAEKRGQFDPSLFDSSKAKGSLLSDAIDLALGEELSDEKSIPPVEALADDCWVYAPCSPGFGDGAMTMTLPDGDKIRHRVVSTGSWPRDNGRDAEWSELCVLAGEVICNNVEHVINPSPVAVSLLIWIVEHYKVKVTISQRSGPSLALQSNSYYKTAEHGDHPFPRQVFYFDGAFVSSKTDAGRGIFRRFEPSASSHVVSMSPLIVEQKSVRYRVTCHAEHDGFYSALENDYQDCLRVSIRPIYVPVPIPTKVNECGYCSVPVFDMRGKTEAVPCSLSYIQGEGFPVTLGPAYRCRDNLTFYPYRLLGNVAEPHGLISAKVLLDASRSPRMKLADESSWTAASYAAHESMGLEPGEARNALVATAVAILAYSNVRQEMRAGVSAAAVNGIIKYEQIGRSWRLIFAGRPDLMGRAELFIARHPGVGNLLNWLVSHSLSPYGGWMLALIQSIVGFIPGIHPLTTLEEAFGDYLRTDVVAFAGLQRTAYIERCDKNYINSKRPDFNLVDSKIDPLHDVTVLRDDELIMKTESPAPFAVTQAKQVEFRIHELEIDGRDRPCWLAGPLVVHAVACFSSVCTPAALLFRQCVARPDCNAELLKTIGDMGCDYLADFFPSPVSEQAHSPADYERWLESQKPNVRAAHARRNLKGDWPSAAHCNVNGSAFTKSEFHCPHRPKPNKADEIKLPRIIGDSHETANYHYAPDVERVFKRSPYFGEAFCGARHKGVPRHFYSPGSKGEAIVHVLEEMCMDEDCLVVLCDVTKWDAHIRPEHVETIIQWYIIMGFSEDAIKVIRRKLGSSLVIRNKAEEPVMKADLDGTVKSGTPDTTFGNTLFNIFLMALCVGRAVNGNSDYKNWIYIPVVTASGDDSIVVVWTRGAGPLRRYILAGRDCSATEFNTAVSELGRSLGFLFKVSSNLHGVDGISYCGGRIFPVQPKVVSYKLPFATQRALPDHARLVRRAFGNSPKRQMPKLGYVCEQSSWRNACAVHAGTVVQQAPLYRHVPFLGCLWAAQLPIALASRRAAPAHLHHKVYNQHQYEPPTAPDYWRYDDLVNDDGQPFVIEGLSLSQSLINFELRYANLSESLMPERTLLLHDTTIAAILDGDL